MLFSFILLDKLLKAKKEESIVESASSVSTKSDNNLIEIASLTNKLNADDNMPIEVHTAQGSVCGGIQNSPEIELKFRPHALYDFIFAPHVSRTGVH